MALPPPQKNTSATPGNPRIKKGTHRNRISRWKIDRHERLCSNCLLRSRLKDDSNATAIDDNNYRWLTQSANPTDNNPLTMPKEFLRYFSTTCPDMQQLIAGQRAPFPCTLPRICARVIRPQKQQYLVAT
jgi:hypothetical protein